MRRCTLLRDSSAMIGRISRSQSRQWRPYSSGTVPKEDANNKSAESQAATTETNNHDSFKIDQEQKKVDTVFGPLPLSPVMDPTYWETEQKHHKNKPKPGKPQNSVERQIRANPYAQALATPLRFDVTTRTRLPSFFLQDFDIVAHPETGAPWWVPRSLALDKPLSAEAEHEIEDEVETSMSADMVEAPGNDDAGEETAVSTVSAASQQQQPKVSKDDNRGTGKPVAYGPSAHVLARKDLFEAFQDKGSGFAGRQRGLHAQVSSPYKTMAFGSQWREDMGTVVLDLMRQHIVKDLFYLSKLCSEKKRYYIVKCFGWNEIQYKHKGAVLWFGNLAASEAEGQKEEVMKTGTEPGPFATYEFETDSEVRLGLKTMASVAVHNMRMLLGPEHAQRVKSEGKVFQDGEIFMAAGRRTTDLQLKLWKLQGHIADYKNP